MVENLFVRETETGYTGGLYRAEPQKQISGSYITAVDSKEKRIKFKRPWTPWSPLQDALDFTDGDVSVYFEEKDEEFVIKRSENYEAHCYWDDLAVEELGRIPLSVGREAAKRRCLDDFLVHYPRKHDGCYSVRDGQLVPHSEYDKKYLLRQNELEWKEL